MREHTALRVSEGDYPVECDICGFEYWRTECRFQEIPDAVHGVQVTNLLACEACFDDAYAQERRPEREGMPVENPRGPNDRDAVIPKASPDEADSDASAATSRPPESWFL